MNAYTLLYIQSFLPLPAFSLTFEHEKASANATVASRCVAQSYVTTPSVLVPTPPLTRAQTILSDYDPVEYDVSPRDGLPSSSRSSAINATHNDTHHTPASMAMGSSSAREEDVVTPADACTLATAPLALVAAHPSIRMMLQTRHAPLTCPHGRRLHIDAHERFSSPLRSGSKCQAGSTEHDAFTLSWRCRTSVGRVDCVECQRSGALGRRALVAYCRQQLAVPQRCSGEAALPSSSHGCTVGQVRLLQERYDVPRARRRSDSGVDGPAAPLCFSVTLMRHSGTSARALPAASSEPSPCELPLRGGHSPLSYSPWQEPILTLPSSSGDSISSSAVEWSVPPDNVVRQLELAMWWLRRCVRQVAERLPNHSARDRAGAATPAERRPASPPLSPLSTSTADLAAKDSANRVMAAVASVRSLRAARTGAKGVAWQDFQRSSPTSSRTASSQHASVRGSVTPDSVLQRACDVLCCPPVQFSLATVGLSCAALTQCYHVLTLLPSPCSVSRLFVHWEDSSVGEGSRISRCASPRPPSSFSVRSASTLSCGRVSPAAATACEGMPGVPTTSFTGAGVCRGGGTPPSHPQDPLTSESAADLCAPLPLPAQLPTLFQSLEELILSGLPSSSYVGSSVRWVEELLRQLQTGVAVPTDYPQRTPTASCSAKRLSYCTRVAAAPQLRRLLLLEGWQVRSAAACRTESPITRAAARSAAAAALSAPLFPPAASHPRTVSASLFPPLSVQQGRQVLASPVESEQGMTEIETREGEALAWKLPADARDAAGMQLSASPTSQQQQQQQRWQHETRSRTMYAPRSAPSLSSYSTKIITTDAPSRSAQETNEALPIQLLPLLPSPLEELYVARTVSCVLSNDSNSNGGSSSSSTATMTTRASPVAAAAVVPVQLHVSGSAAIVAAAPLLFPSTPPPPPQLPWVCQFSTLCSLNLSHSSVTDDVCGNIVAALPRLRELHLSWCTDLQDVTTVLRRARTRRLRVLNLVGLRVLTSSALETLCLRACPRLLHTVEALYLAQCPVMAVGCLAFACPMLRRLQLPDATVLDAAVAACMLGDGDGDDDCRRRDTTVAPHAEASLPRRGNQHPLFAEILAGENTSTLLLPPLSASFASPVRGTAVSVQGYSGLIVLLSCLFPTLTQLRVYNVDRMLVARAERRTSRHVWSSGTEAVEEEEEEEEEEREEGESGVTSLSSAELVSLRVAYADHQRHGELHNLPRLLPQLQALYLDGCTDLGQLLQEPADGEAPFAFGGTTLSLTSAVDDAETLERLLTRHRGALAGSWTGPMPQPSYSSNSNISSIGNEHSPCFFAFPSDLSASSTSCLQDLRLSGCRSLRAGPMARVVVRCCPGLRVLSLADTQLTDAALAHLCVGLRRTLTSIDLCGCYSLTDVGPLLRCAALQHVRLPDGQSLTARTISVEFKEGLRGLCALLGRLCPDLRRLQLHSKGSMDAAEVAEVALLGRWVKEVDLSQLVGMNASTMLALTAPSAPANVNGALTRVNLSYTAMNNTMLRTLVSGCLGPQLQELRLHGCHCVSDVACLSVRCRRLRVLKLSGTSVEASSLSSLLEGLPHLEDLDVRYCTRIRDVHWLAEVLLKYAERPHRDVQQRPTSQRLHTRCSQCPVILAHRPTMTLAAVRDATVVAAVASPLTSGRSATRPAGSGSPSRGTSSGNNVVENRRQQRQQQQQRMYDLDSTLSTTAVVYKPKPNSAPPALSLTPSTEVDDRRRHLCENARHVLPSSSSSSGLARAGDECGPSCRLAQVAFGNNHCYLTRCHPKEARRDGGSVFTSCSKDPSEWQAGETAGVASLRSDAENTTVTATPENTVVLQEAIPGLFAVLAMWRPQTSVLVLLRPGSMGHHEWHEVEQWMPQLRIQEMTL